MHEYVCMYTCMSVCIYASMYVYQVYAPLSLYINLVYVNRKELAATLQI